MIMNLLKILLMNRGFDCPIYHSVVLIEFRSEHELKRKSLRLFPVQCVGVISCLFLLNTPGTLRGGVNRCGDLFNNLLTIWKIIDHNQKQLSIDHHQIINTEIIV
jgi:hypothetical protein